MSSSIRRDARLVGGRFATWRAWPKTLALTRCGLTITSSMTPPLVQNGAGPRGFWDAWMLLAALAEATRRVTLGPLVTCTGYRNPALLAKMADSLDEISGGRLILGLGAGWHAPEYRAFGYPFDRLASRFEEALAIIIPFVADGPGRFPGRLLRGP